MANEKDPLKDFLTPGFELFPAPDLEAGIMSAVREEAILRQKARQLRRKGLMFLCLFLLLLVLALWSTSNGYSNTVYKNPFIGLGMATLALLILFAQLEAWKSRPVA